MPKAVLLVKMEAAVDKQELMCRNILSRFTEQIKLLREEIQGFMIEENEETKQCFQKAMSKTEDCLSILEKAVNETASEGKSDIAAARGMSEEEILEKMARQMATAKKMGNRERRSEADKSLPGGAENSGYGLQEREQQKRSPGQETREEERW